MRLGLPALAAGLLALRLLPELPSAGWLLAAAAAGLLLLFGRLYWLGLFLLGFAWACVSAQAALDGRLAAELDGRTLWLEGRISGLPASGNGVTRFQLEGVSSPREALPGRLRLSWRGALPLMGGERWRLAVNLKRPRGLVNTAGFDYEAWLLAQRIGAIGTVKAGERLRPASGLDAWRDAWRQRLLAADTQGRGGALAALVLGDGSGLRADEWRMLQDTGTVHLMVISGSHISLLAGMLYGLVAGLFRLGCWPRRLPWLPCACGLALAGAWGYGLMAGFEVPVRRACLMVSLALLWRLRFRHLGVSRPLLGTLVLVLLAEPLACLQAGFWLSFLAVALLLWLFAGRLGRWRWWTAWGRAQWGMALGLAMPSLALGLPLSLSGALANLLAVPWVEMLVVPPALAGSLLLGVPGVGESLLWIAGASLDQLFHLLVLLAGLAGAWQPPAATAWGVALGMLGALCWLAPAGLPVRGLGALLMLPALAPLLRPIEAGYAEVRMLDVGQGLAVLLRTRGHALLYDAGARQGDFDMGERVVLPVLRSLDLRRLDGLLLSHADNDHAGGAPAVVSRFAPGWVVSGEPARLPSSLAARGCEERRWEWDGVTFAQWSWARADSANDRSCVLRVEARGEVLLLTGDIARAAEYAWLARQGEPRVDWLQAPHHGSRSSSGEAFVRRTRPHHVLVSRGWRNAFGHPHAEVVQRYAGIAAQIHDTARDGALTFTLGRGGEARGEREAAHFWREK
ncbi:MULTISPECIES: DNA internalization-related competence protein ComEC/Rec2 [Pseudomonas aeruginosa group]|uniref:DNA internalization-related competence protein ComEC/Rec2 n=1 Tax=Pseudomonas aeruginosa group TaxID=136841 RepID=UPI00071B32F9|nr:MULTISPECIES: DNA internalization-related competence protein ComEC/Rec2 [Pseudomonas aeruginosa group]KSD16608.1 DNA internalization-related competence protein ComEC/Rec2 [Pseudomonas aeruginosa]